MIFFHKSKHLFLFVIVLCIQFACVRCDEIKIVIDIPSYNNKDWCRMNLASVYRQKYANHRIIITDDCSSDGTGDLIERYIQQQSEENRNRTTFIRNKVRRGAMANHYAAIQACRDDEVIVQLDGDDFFADDSVLSTVNSMYRDLRVWFTYGIYINWPANDLAKTMHCFSKPLDRYSVLDRQHVPFIFGPLRTYRAWLVKLIKLEDLIADKEPCPGKFYSSASDVALMFPILEMAREHHIFNRTHKMYFRNIDTPINDFKVNKPTQDQCTRLIFGLPVYQPVAGPIYNDQGRVAVGGFVFSNKGPDQLELFLKALNDTCTDKGLIAVTIVYASKSDEEKARYDFLQNNFVAYNFVDVAKLPGKDVCAEVRNIAQNSDVDYFLITTSDFIVTRNVPIEHYAKIMKKTYAYTFSMAPPSIPGATTEWLKDDIHIWKFKCAQPSWLCPHNTAMSLYARQDVLEVLKKMPATSPENFSNEWSKIVIDEHKVGLFCKKNSLAR